MRTWNQLSELEQLQSEYSDFFKAVNGFRPRGMTQGWTKEDFEREFKILGAESDRQEHEEALRTIELQGKFEADINELQDLGAGDRETAVRWWFAANGYQPSEGDHSSLGWDAQNAEHVLYCLGFPIPMWKGILKEFIPGYGDYGLLNKAA